MTRQEQERRVRAVLTEGMTPRAARDYAEAIVAALSESPAQRVARLFSAPGWRVADAAKSARVADLKADRLRRACPTWHVRVRAGLREDDGTEWCAVEVRAEPKEAT